MLQSALSLFIVSCLLGCLDCTELSVKQGEDATLECSGPRDATEIMINWDKPDLQPEAYLLFFKDDDIQEEFQHELFKGRVKLKDPNWKETGDFSVILKHVTTNDAGRYECYAGYNGQRPELLSRVTVKVETTGQTEEQKMDGGNKGEEKEEEGNQHGSAGLIVGAVAVVGVVLGVVAGVFVYFYKCRSTRTKYQAPQGQNEAERNSDSHQQDLQRKEEEEEDTNI